MNGAGNGLASKDKARQARYPEQHAVIFQNVPEDRGFLSLSPPKNTNNQLPLGNLGWMSPGAPSTVSDIKPKGFGKSHCGFSVARSTPIVEIGWLGESLAVLIVWSFCFKFLL